MGTPEGYRLCTDDERNLQMRCFTCAQYSFKSWTNEGNNEGDCFVDFPKLYWVKGNGICSRFQKENNNED